MLSLISEAARESWGKTSPTHSQPVVSFVLSRKHLCCAYAMCTNNTIYLNRYSYYIRITSCTNRDLFIQQPFRIVLFPYSFFQLKFVSFDPNLEKVNVNESSLIH